MFINDILQTPKSTAEKSYSDKKEITPSDSNQNLDIPKIRITRIKDYSKSLQIITESFKSHN